MKILLYLYTGMVVTVKQYVCISTRGVTIRKNVLRYFFTVLHYIAFNIFSWRWRLLHLTRLFFHCLPCREERYHFEDRSKVKVIGKSGDATLYNCPLYIDTRTCMQDIKR